VPPGAPSGTAAGGEDDPAGAVVADHGEGDGEGEGADGGPARREGPPRRRGRPPSGLERLGLFSQKKPRNWFYFFCGILNRESACGPPKGVGQEEANAGLAPGWDTGPLARQARQGSPSLPPPSTKKRTDWVRSHLVRDGRRRMAGTTTRGLAAPNKG